MRLRLSPYLALLIVRTAPLHAAGPYVHSLDWQALLPPPPALHGPEDKADRDEAYAVYRARTPGDMQRAIAEHSTTFLAFAPAIGRDFKPGQYPKLEALSEAVEVAAKSSIDGAKEYWRRPRPYQDDPARFSHPGDPEKGPSYPSGHSTRGTVLALVLAEIFPAQRDAILAKGRLIGWTRVEVGVHTPLDIYVGRVLGQAIFHQLMQDPAFQADLAAVKAEMAAPRP
jgi:acid phosphatase (class A)